jgi:ubiquinone/menaquinone biosynthesis C-methylase UbiE
MENAFGVDEQREKAYHIPDSLGNRCDITMTMNLLKEYFSSSRDESRMRGAGDVAAARAEYFSKRPQNLHYLLSKRIAWINDYLPQEASLIVELGCGMGITREFIRHPALKLTDYAPNPWVDMQADALAMPWRDESVDVLIVINALHHLAYPSLFFKEAARVLKTGGRLLIRDATASLAMRLALLLMRHEGYSFLRDPFDTSVPCNDPQDAWSGNNAISDLLFAHPERFQAEFPSLKIEKQWFEEFLIFPLSGGVTAKKGTVQLPWSVLRLIDRFDNFLVGNWPRLFAFQRNVVLKKVPVTA